MDIFLTSSLHLQTDLGPCNLEAAEHIGIGEDPEAIYNVMKRYPGSMCWLSKVGLTYSVRLEAVERLIFAQDTSNPLSCWPK